MLRSERRNALSRVALQLMPMDYIRTCHKEVKQRLWDDRTAGMSGLREVLFVGFLQVFIDKMLTALKNTALVAYSIHAIVLNVLTRRT